MNYKPSDVTNRGWNKLGIFISYYNRITINNQPSTYGQLINIPATRDNKESTQLWIEQCAGRIYYRGGNDSVIVNDTAFKQVATVTS